MFRRRRRKSNPIPNVVKTSKRNEGGLWCWKTAKLCFGSYWKAEADVLSTMCIVRCSRRFLKTGKFYNLKNGTVSGIQGSNARGGATFFDSIQTQCAQGRNEAAPDSSIFGFLIPNDDWIGAVAMRWRGVGRGLGIAKSFMLIRTGRWLKLQ